jgi:hypothetical protein
MDAPLETGRAGQMPYNPMTNKPYRDGTVLCLMKSGMRKGYPRQPRVWPDY